VQLTSRGRLRPLRGDGWEESRQFSQPDASLPALPALAAAAADMLSRPTVPAGASKHPALVPIEEIERRLASEGAARDHSFPAMPNPPPPRKHSSGQPAQSRQSDANIVPQAPQPRPGWGASEPAFSAWDAQFFGNCHRTWWKVSSQYRDHSLSPFTEGQLPLGWLVLNTVKSQRSGS